MIAMAATIAVSLIMDPRQNDMAGTISKTQSRDEFW
jgi:hypothetical protein